MIELLATILNALCLMDSKAPEDGPSTWSRRHRKLIRVLLILCMAPFCLVFLVLLAEWLSNLGPVAQKVAIGLGVIQLIGFLVLLARRRKA